MKRERQFRKLMVSLFAVSAMVAVAQGYTYHTAVSEYTAMVKETDTFFDRVRYARRLTAFLAEAESGQRGYLMTGNIAYRKPYDQSINLLKSVMADLLANMPKEREEEIAKVKAAVATKMAEMHRTIEVFDGQGYEAALRIVKTDEGKDSMDVARSILERFIAEDLAVSNRLHGEMAAQSSTTSQRWLYLTASVLIGLFAGMAALWRTSRKIGELAAVLEHEAHHDVLTGLPNRKFFCETLDYVIAVARREKRRIAVSFLDLNGFKAINDELGHDIGDLALIEVSKSLKEVFRESDFAARLGGDEFVVIIHSVDDACNVCSRIKEAIHTTTHPDFKGKQLGTSIGIGVFPDDGDTVESLLAVADARMYEQKQAKKAGKTISLCSICQSDTICPESIDTSNGLAL
ncbi:MAG: diguanylate cyclase [Magnetococcales bacterium]|nr:diguanylate cyclase [Magnetococcales bacterium]NGZ07140.1 diguanylate cyclase [Magnetococcales bacterium]